MRGDRTAVRQALLSAGVCLFLSASLWQCSRREPAEEETVRPLPAKVVLGYYPAWRKAEFGLTSLRFEHLTHIAHAFTKPDSAGNLVVEPDYLYPELVAEAHRRGVKVLMSIGGWGNCEGFPGMAALPPTRARFVGQVRDFLKTNGYDGADIDWEFVSNPAERLDFVSFIKELSEAFKAEKPPLLLTMAAPAGDYWARWIDFEALAGAFDYIGFMTYDFHGPWTDHSGHNSPLYLCGGDACGSLDDTFAYGLSRQVPKEKLLVGLAFYGRSFDCPELYQPYKQSLEYTYAEVASLLSRGWTRSWDECAKLPVARPPDGKVIISYDDEQSVAAKCRYVLDKNSAGVIIWELTQDTVNGQPVLLNVVGSAFAKKE
jgi:chitinase